MILEPTRADVRERKPLPTREQINAIFDAQALEDMRDEIERRIARIETDLDFRDDTEEWERRAKSALALHRYTANIIDRRLAVLRKGKGQPFAALAALQQRERTECHALSWALLDGDVSLDEAGETAAEIDAAIERISEALDALEADRADEVRRPPGHRDEAWLAEANSAMRRARAARHELTLKKAAIRKREKMEAQRVVDLERERMFIDEARAVLPRETFLLIWDRVDRRQMAEPDGRGG